MQTLSLKRIIVAVAIALAIAFTVKVTGLADKMQAWGEAHPVPGFSASHR